MDTQRINQLSHEAALELLPWHVNASLDSSLQQQVSEHLEQCVHCQKEAALLANTLFAVNAEEPNYGQVDERLKGVMNRIDAFERLETTGTQESLLDRVANWFQSQLFTLTGLRVAAGLLTVAAVVGILASLPLDNEKQVYKVVENAVDVAPLVLTVYLDESVDKSEIQGLIASTTTDFELGQQTSLRYVVTLPAKTTALDVRTLWKTLEDNPKVQRVEMVPE